MSRCHGRRSQPPAACSTIEVEITVLNSWVERGEVHVLVHVPILGLTHYRWPIDDLIGAPIR